MPPLVLHAFFGRALFWCMATIGLAAAAPAWAIDNQAQYQACKAMFGGFIDKFGGKGRAQPYLAKAA